MSSQEPTRDDAAYKAALHLLFVGPIRAIQALCHPERRHEVTAIVAITAPPA